MIDVAFDPQVTDSLLQWRGRRIFPTEFGSADLRALSSGLHLRSITSARTTNAGYLQEVQGVVDKILAGEFNVAEGRYRLMRKLKEAGYDPAVGFPQDMASVPPAEAGSLQDLSSERRIDLVLKTNVAIARNCARAAAGNGAAARFAFPGWELVRFELRNVPRGTPESHTAGWQRRWADAGESVGWVGASQTRMVALKDSPIWPALGEGAGGYGDTLGHPFPPFAFHSGMDWRAAPRAECRALGLIAGEESPARVPAELAPLVKETQAIFDKFEPGFRAELLRELQQEREEALAAA